MKVRYNIFEVEGFNGGDGTRVRVFYVEWSLTKWPWREHTEVWWREADGRGNCTNCQSVRSAMSGSCAHVAATRRHLRAQAPLTPPH